ncbi:MAG: hypothetical protein AAGC97_03615 [Planctomycetota bacterium]
MAFAAAQLSYLVDLGMRPDADDAVAEEFVRTLNPDEEAAFHRIASESEPGDGGEEGDDLQRDDAGNDAEGDQTITRDAAGGDNSSASDTTPGDTDIQELVRRELDNRDRVRQERLAFIREQAGDDIPRDLVERAMAEEWPQERVSREFLSAVRTRPAAVQGGGAGSAPAAHTRSHEGNCTLGALQGGILLREGIELDDELFRTPAANAVLRRENVRGSWLHRMATAGDRSGGELDQFHRDRDEAHRWSSRSLVDICREALRISRRNVPIDQDDMVRRALSTVALDAIFSPSVNMQIIAAYLGVQDTTNGWVRPAELRDFKKVERGRLTKASGLKKLARGGTPNPIEFSDEVEEYKLARYAGKFEVSEEDIIDDSFGGLSEHTPSELGEMAAEIRPNLVYSILLGNPDMRDAKALFHADHGNLFDVALGVAGLDAMKVAMRTQRENGRHIRNAMRFLIVPEALDFTARQLISSAELRNPAGAGAEGTANPHQNRFTIVSDPRLDNGVEDPDTGEFHAGSDTQFFGAAAAGSNSIEVGYRRGTGRAPRMSTYLLPGDRYGMGWKCDLDIAAKAIDWRSYGKSVPAG